MSKHKVLIVCKVLSAVSTNDLGVKTQCSEFHRAYGPLSQHGTKTNKLLARFAVGA